MKPFVYGLFLLVILNHCNCYNVTYMKELKESWLSAVKRTNGSQLKLLFARDDFSLLLDILDSMKSRKKQLSFFQEIKSVIVENSYENVKELKAGVFTNYCGPGDTANGAGETVAGFMTDIDKCCKIHDDCDEQVMTKNDFNLYPSLPKKNLYFTSLSCNCDRLFYNCMKQTETILADLIMWIYTIAQSSCFQKEYKIERCSKYDE
ncbi:unnamed protein product [Diamesa serratosioi]